eukprot:scaffold68726_cov75-Phaeocystis_antarctica.AAC.1
MRLQASSLVSERGAPTAEHYSLAEEWKPYCPLTAQPVFCATGRSAATGCCCRRRDGNAGGRDAF